MVTEKSEGPGHRHDLWSGVHPQGQDDFGTRCLSTGLRVQQADRHVPQAPALLHRRRLLRVSIYINSVAIERAFHVFDINLQHGGVALSRDRVDLLLLDRVLREHWRVIILGLHELHL